MVHEGRFLPLPGPPIHISQTRRHEAGDPLLKRPDPAKSYEQLEAEQEQRWNEQILEGLKWRRQLVKCDFGFGQSQGYSLRL